MKKYSQEFKDSTVQLIINNNENVKDIGIDLDLNPKTLYSWVTAYKKQHNIPIRNILHSKRVRQKNLNALDVRIRY